ncbi:LysE family transporter [Microbacterium hibisci]|uniref:LysE family transporter n=1 Tax=Microbacterium hibisci TaxID=2036000 RepID=UPI0019427D13|nr:LysE family transporter [Microbacterium hibisci]
MDVLLTFPVGVLAGLALAAPLGAIGVLLIQEGLGCGLRNGLSAAAAVATVDTVYCTVAVSAGTLAAPVVAGWAPWPQLAGGAILVVIGARALAKRRRSPAAEAPGLAPSTRGRFLLFLTLTAINPATLLYFVAILPALHDVATSIPAQVAFVAGVAAASFGWQAALVAVGSVLRRGTGPKFHVWTAIIGNGAVIVFGIAIIVQAVWSQRG